MVFTLFLRFLKENLQKFHSTYKSHLKEVPVPDSQVSLNGVKWIRIQLSISRRNRIRIQGAKPIRINADPDPSQT
jgi:hypothetical protein